MAEYDCSTDPDINCYTSDYDIPDYDEVAFTAGFLGEALEILSIGAPMFIVLGILLIILYFVNR